MKLVKKILYGILGLVILLLVVCGIVLIADSRNTAYLKIRKLPDADKNSYFIKNVNIVPMTADTVLANQCVRIVDGIIQDIGSRLTAGNLTVIDAHDSFLAPGLTDMHVHLWDKYEAGLYLSNGVTAIRNVWGMPMHLRLKKSIQNNKMIAPMFYTTGPKLTGPEFIGDDNLQLYSADEARNKVISCKKRGYDFIKTYYGLPKDMFDAVIEQAGISGMDIVAHPSQKIPFSYHFKPAIITIEHAEDIVQEALDYKLDSAGLDDVVKVFSGSPHTSFCPTLIAYYNIYNMLTNDSILNAKPVEFMNASIRVTDSKSQFNRWQSAKKEDSLVTMRIKRQHEFHLFIIKKLHEVGVNLVCGTDAGIGITVPGFSIHQELAIYKEAGLSDYEVLKTATINVSKTHRVFKDVGTIEKGKIANLLLLKNNPLQNIEALQQPGTVFMKGIKLDRNTLNQFEDKARNRKNLLATLVRYAEYLLVER